MSDINTILGGAATPEQTTAPKQEQQSFGNDLPFEDPFGGLDQITTNDVKSANDNSLPVGDYTVSLEKIELKITSKGTPMATVAFKVIDGPKYVNKVEYVPFFLKKRDGEKNMAAIGELITIIEKAYGITAEQALEVFKKQIAQLTTSGDNLLALPATPAMVTGTLSVTQNGEWTNRKFKKA